MTKTVFSEDDKGRMVALFMAQSMIGRLDAHATGLGITRSELIRRMCEDGIRSIEK